MKIGEFAQRPRYVVSEEWGHFFSNARREDEVRWVFDRRTWRLCVLEILEEDGWTGAFEEERLDVEDSLVNTNPEAIEGDDDWDLDELDGLLDWVPGGVVQDRANLLDDEQVRWWRENPNGLRFGFPG